MDLETVRDSTSILRENRSLDEEKEMEDTKLSSVIGITSRRFMRADAGAGVATSCLSTLNHRRRGFAPLMYTLKSLSVVFIVLLSFPGLAYEQQSPSPPVTKLVPPAHGKIPVAFIVGPGAETIDF